MKTLTLLTLLCSLQGTTPFVHPAPHRCHYQATKYHVKQRTRSLPIAPFRGGPFARPRAVLPQRRNQRPRSTLYAGGNQEQIIASASMVLLAIQFGAMPTLQKKCVPRNLCRSSMVIAQEISKFTLSAVCFLCLLSPLQRAQMLQSWTVSQWMQLAGIPAGLYAIQNYAKLVAYQHLPAVTYSVLNQTKTLSTAMFCYLLLGVPQSALQMVALILLLTSALVIEEVIPIPLGTNRNSKWKASSSSSAATSRPSGFYNNSLLPNFSGLWGRRQDIRLFSCVSSEQEQKKDVCASRSGLFHSDTRGPDPKQASIGIPRDPHHFTRGVLPLLLANLTSGLAGALGQRALQHHQRNLYLYGMELASASFLLVLLSLIWSPDGQQIRREGIRCHWKAVTFLPIAAHAVGGMLVGLVTKYAGSVQKGFALIFGVLLSGLFQKWLSKEPVTKHQILGGVLACISTWMHVSFPPEVAAYMPR